MELLYLPFVNDLREKSAYFLFYCSLFVVELEVEPSGVGLHVSVIKARKALRLYFPFWETEREKIYKKTKKQTGFEASP